MVTKSIFVLRISEQVAAESELAAFEETEGAFDESAAEQMAALEAILKDAQMSAGPVGTPHWSPLSSQATRGSKSDI